MNLLIYIQKKKKRENNYNNVFLIYLAKSNMIYIK